jgi:hypothetical protein
MHTVRNERIKLPADANEIGVGAIRARIVAPMTREGINALTSLAI